MTTLATKNVSLSDAASQLAELVRLAQEGTDVVLTQDGLPVARLTPAESSISRAFRDSTRGKPGSAMTSMPNHLMSFGWGRSELLT
jgi:prevent-host-death family protein